MKGCCCFAGPANRKQDNPSPAARELPLHKGAFFIVRRGSSLWSHVVYPHKGAFFILHCAEAINETCAKTKHFYFLSLLLSIDLKGTEKYNKMVYIFFILDQYVV